MQERSRNDDRPPAATPSASTFAGASVDRQPTDDQLEIVVADTGLGGTGRGAGSSRRRLASIRSGIRERARRRRASCA